ncbi:hypothetical protein [Bradyrhizobium sp. Ec3.3]|uniref:hypothetical protein n=1 Tax=Bradyrhizobium sp. Ec3.3 TaxID=189753 RepID=UPI0012EC8CB3|nr:hypothetical protein [Bradyrhizobium sp. Ec3.3]
MSGHLRVFCSAAFLLLAGLSTSPALSNPFSGLLGQADPVEASPPAPSNSDCASQPGKSSAEGQHWVYRFDGRRKCWFQAAEGTLIGKKSVRHQAAKHAAPSKKSEAAPRSGKVAVDARAELLPSAPTDANRHAPSAPELKVADASPVVATEAPALAPSEPGIARLPADRLTPLDPKGGQVDVEMLLAAMPADGDAVVPPTAPAVAVPAAEAGEDGLGWTATLLGVLLMAMGLVVLLSSSRALRRGVLTVRQVRQFISEGGWAVANDDLQAS